MMNSSEREDRIVIYILFFASLLFRIPQIFESVEYDEAKDLFYLSMGRLAINQAFTSRTPTLGFSLLFPLANYNIYILRAFCIFVNSITTVFYFLILKKWGRQVAFISAILFVIHPIIIWYSSIFRPYAFVLLFQMVSIYLLLSGSLYSGLLFSVLSIYFHDFSWLTFFPSLLYVIHIKRGAIFKNFFLFILAILLIPPLARSFSILKDTSAELFGHRGGVGLEIFKNLFSNFFHFAGFTPDFYYHIGFPIPRQNEPGFIEVILLLTPIFIFFIVLCISIIFLFRMKIVLLPVLFLIYFLIFPSLLPILGTFVYDARYIIFALPIFFFMVSLTFEVKKFRPLIFIYALISVVIYFVGLNIKETYTKPISHKLTKILKNYENTVIVLTSFEYPLLRFFYPDKRFIVLVPEVMSEIEFRMFRNSLFFGPKKCERVKLLLKNKKFIYIRVKFPDYKICDIGDRKDFYYLYKTNFIFAKYYF